MTTTQWIVTAIVALVGGGAMGAVITAYFSYKRNKRQPVVYTMEIIDIFRKGANFPRLAKLLVTEHPLGFGKERSVDNLSLARINVTNKGNQDIKEFTFGVTMDGGNKTVDIRFSGTDRHHVIKMGLPGVVVQEEPKDPVKAVDFYLEPFNREDTYKVDIYFTYDKKRGKVRLSSPHSTEFVEKRESGERWEKVLSNDLATSIVLAASVLAASALVVPLIGWFRNTSPLEPIDEQTLEKLKENNRQFIERLVREGQQGSATASPTPTPK